MRTGQRKVFRFLALRTRSQAGEGIFPVPDGRSGAGRTERSDGVQLPYSFCLCLRLQQQITTLADFLIEPLVVLPIEGTITGAEPLEGGGHTGPHFGVVYVVAGLQLRQQRGAVEGQLTVVLRKKRRAHVAVRLQVLSADAQEPM